MIDLPITHFEARLCLASALHIGAGNPALGAREILLARAGLRNEPCIPGSSLKGRMRALLALHLPRSLQDAIVELFGVQGRRGLLSFADCPIDPDWVRTSCSDPVTLRSEQVTGRQLAGRARQPVWRQREVVRAGAEFLFRATLATRHPEAVEVVLTGLKLMEWEGLGAGTSRGMGRVRFVQLRVDRRDAQARFDAIGAPA